MILFFFILTLLIIKLYLDLKIKEFFFRQKIFIDNFKALFFSYLVIMIFIIIFIIIFRFLRLFFFDQIYFDIKRIIYFLFFFSDIYGYNFILGLLILLLLIFSTVRKIIIMFVKFNFIRIFYIHYRIFDKYIYFFFEIKIKFMTKIHWVVLIFINFILNYFFISIIFIFFFKAIFFDNGMFFVKYLPYIALYYFLLNIIKFFIGFNPEFDIVSAFLYKKLSISTECFFKLKEYHMFLVLSKSDYIFIDYSISKNFIEDEQYVYLVPNKDFFISYK